MLLFLDATNAEGFRGREVLLRVGAFWESLAKTTWPRAIPPAFGLMRPLLFLFALLPRKPSFRLELILFLLRAKVRLELEDKKLMLDFSSRREFELISIGWLLLPVPDDDRDDCRLDLLLCTDCYLCELKFLTTTSLHLIITYSNRLEFFLHIFVLFQKSALRKFLLVAVNLH